MAIIASFIILIYAVVQRSKQHLEGKGQSCPCALN